jgi:hypothetical protein
MPTGERVRRNAEYQAYLLGARDGETRFPARLEGPHMREQRRALRKAARRFMLDAEGGLLREVERERGVHVAVQVPTTAAALLRALDAAHAQHGGFNRTEERFKAGWDFAKLRPLVRALVNNCVDCLAQRGLVPVEPLVPIRTSRPLERVYVDFTYMPLDGKGYLCVCARARARPACMCFRVFFLLASSRRAVHRCPSPRAVISRYHGGLFFPPAASA